MRSPIGELCSAAHTRHAAAEMRGLGDEIAAQIANAPALTELLARVGADASGQLAWPGDRRQR